MTHRALMLAGIAKSPSTIRNPLLGDDCLSTAQCLRQLGIDVEILSGAMQVAPRQWHDPERDLDCGNSGTTMRLLAGLIASRNVSATLTGDESLSKRPMRRIAEPLRLMGARIEGDFPPLEIRRSGKLRGIDYATPVASAQIKSCVLLAGLAAEGVTSVTEPEPSRDHTERMLAGLGVRIERDGLRISIQGGQVIDGFEFDVPGDISSAAFALCAAAAIEGSEITLRSVGANPTRTGILDVLTTIGTEISLCNAPESMGEPVSDLNVRSAARNPFAIEGPIIPRLIDEIPMLAILATQLEGISTIRGAMELRVKESDRIELVAGGLRTMGAEVETFEDGLAIAGPAKLRGSEIHACHDHRIAMAFAVAGMLAEGESRISGEESIATSYPRFVDDMVSLGADIVQA